MRLLQHSGASAARKGGDGAGEGLPRPLTGGQEPPGPPEEGHAREREAGQTALAAGYAAAAAGLLAWGYAVLPGGNGWGLAWWPVALAGIGAGGGLVGREWRQARARAGRERRGGPGTAWRRAPLGLVVIGLAGFWLNSYVVLANQQPLRHDSFEYSRLAYQYAQQGYTPHPVRTPGYTLLLAGIFKVAGTPPPERDELFGPRSPYKLNQQALDAWRVQRFMLLAAALAAYAIVSELYAARGGVGTARWRVGPLYLGQPPALAAAALVAGCPFLIAYSGLSMTEIPATLWLTLAVFLWLKALRFERVAAYPLLLGAVTAILLQTRPTFIYLPVVVGLTLLIRPGGWERRWRWRWRQVALLAGPLGLFLGPQLVANWQTWEVPSPVIAADFSTHQTAVGVLYVTTGGLPRYQIMPSAASYNPTYEPIWERLRNYLPVQAGEIEGRTLSNAERKPLAEAEARYFKQYFTDYVSGHPLEFAGTMLRRLRFMWDQHFVFPYYDPGYFEYRWLTDSLSRLYVVFGLVGIVAAGAVWGRRAGPLWLTLAYLTGLHLLVVIEFRYTLPGYPVWLVMAGLGLWETARALAGGYRGAARWRRLGGLAAAGLLVAAVSVAYPLIGPTNPLREKALDLKAQADEYNEVRQFRQAEQLYNQALALYPGEAQLWSGRGVFWAGGRLPLKALPDYNRAIELDPRAPDPYRWRGEVLAELKRYDEARADYRQFLELAPANHPSRAKIERQLRSPEPGRSGFDPQ